MSKDVVLMMLRELLDRCRCDHDNYDEFYAGVEFTLAIAIIFIERIQED